MKKYKVRKGRSMGIFLVASAFFVLFFSMGLPLIVEKAITYKSLIISIFTTVPLIAFFIWIWFDTYYIVDQEILKAKNGPFVWRVAIKDINLIRLNQPTIIGVIKPTLSFRSMEIVYNKYNSIFITPEQEDKFLDHLKSICSEIQIIDSSKRKSMVGNIADSDLRK